MPSSANLLAAILDTLTRTYPENHPRARARRFFPLFAKVGYFGMLSVLLLGAVALSTASFPFQHVACMVYGVFFIPLFGVGSWMISMRLYHLTVSFMAFKDRFTRKRHVPNSN